MDQDESSGSKNSNLCIKKQTIAAGEQIMIQCTLANDTNDLKLVSAVFTPNETLEQVMDIAFTEYSRERKYHNDLSTQHFRLCITIQQRREVGNFSVLTSEQADKLIQTDLQRISLALLRNTDATIAEINLLNGDETRNGKTHPTRPPPEYHKLWLPTSETCEDPETLPPPQRRIYDEILKFQQMNRVDSLYNQTDKETFLSKFP